MISGQDRSRMRPRSPLVIGLGASALAITLALALVTGLAAGAWPAGDGGDGENADRGGQPAGDVAGAGDAASLNAPQADGDAPPGVAAVAEITLREGPSREITDAAAYRLLLDQESFAWPEGSGAGGLESGIGIVALPNLTKNWAGPNHTTKIAITNLVPSPGFTDFVVVLNDQNGMLDYVFEKLNERQTEYIDLARWAYVNDGFRGSAMISAVFWEHDVYHEDAFVRNALGLLASVVDWSTMSGSHPGTAAGSRGVAYDTSLGIPISPWDLDRPLLLMRPPRHEPPTPTPGPSPTASATPTSTSTPTSTPTPIVPPPYAPEAPELLLPALTWRAHDAECGVVAEIQNVGAEESKAALVIWAEPGNCGDACIGPVAVVCTGLIKSDGAWYLGSGDLPDDAHSGVLFSFSTKTMSEIGLDPNSDDMVADVMCDALSLRLPGNCREYELFKQAFDQGLAYQGIPQGLAWGAPLAARVERRCQSPVADGLPVSSAYTALWGPALGHRSAADGSYEYALPIAHAEASGRPSVVHLQNAGDECASVELWTSEIGMDQPAALCAQADVAAGEAQMVDIATCLQADGSAWVRSTGPLAVTMDSAGPNAMSTYTGAPPSLRNMHGAPLLGASGAVAAAPLVYNNHFSWTTRLTAQNTGTITSVLKVSIIDRAGPALSVRQFGPVRPGASVIIDVGAMAGVPYEFVGSARIESFPIADAPVATPWLGPEPSSTPERTPPYWGRPTRTPGSPVPVTPGTPAPTLTPTNTLEPRPTPTPSIPIERPIYIPVCER